MRWLSWLWRKRAPVAVAPRIVTSVEAHVPARVGYVEPGTPVTATCRRCKRAVEAFRRYADGSTYCIECSTKVDRAKRAN